MEKKSLIANRTAVTKAIIASTPTVDSSFVAVAPKSAAKKATGRLPQALPARAAARATANSGSLLPCNGESSRPRHARPAAHPRKLQPALPDVHPQRARTNPTCFPNGPLLSGPFHFLPGPSRYEVPHFFPDLATKRLPANHQFRFARHSNP